MDTEHLNNRRALFAAGILLAAVLFLPGIVIGALNDLTRLHDLSDHVSNRTCGSEFSCPSELECYSGFNPDRVGVNITGARCVTPVFIERYCGIFTSRIVQASNPPQISGCPSFNIVEAVRYGELSELLDRLAPPPDGSKVLARDSLVAAEEDRRLRPDQPQPTCDNADSSITEASYSNGSVTVTVQNTGHRPLTLNIVARTGDTVVGDAQLSVLKPSETATEQFGVDQRPDDITVAAIGCPSLRASHRLQQPPLPPVSRITYWYNATTHLQINQSTPLFSQLAAEAKEAIDRFKVAETRTIRAENGCRSYLNDTRGLYVEFEQPLNTTRNGYPLTSSAYLLTFSQVNRVFRFSGNSCSPFISSYNYTEPVQRLLGQNGYPVS